MRPKSDINNLITPSSSHCLLPYTARCVLRLLCMWVTSGPWSVHIWVRYWQHFKGNEKSYTYKTHKKSEFRFWKTSEFSTKACSVNPMQINGRSLHDCLLVQLCNVWMKRTLILTMTNDTYLQQQKLSFTSFLTTEDPNITCTSNTKSWIVSSTQVTTSLL